MYEYRAIITKVYDGDTLTADVDMGFNIWSKNIKIRVLGIDTPEIRSKVQSEKKMDDMDEGFIKFCKLVAENK